MNNTRSTLLVTTAAATVLLAACGDQPTDSATRDGTGRHVADIVATVGGEDITREQFTARLARRTHRFSNSETDVFALKREVLEEMIRFRAVLARAKAVGYDRDPEIVAAFERMVVARFQEAKLDGLKSALPDITDDEISAAYQRDRDRYATPEQARAAIIAFKASRKADPDRRAEIERQAASVLARVRDAGDAEFSELARLHSEDPSSRYAGGDIGWLRRDGRTTRWDAGLVEALFALERPGDVAPLLELEDGFYIARLTGRKPADVKPLDAVRDAIRHQLALDRRHETEERFFQEMRSGLSIEINDRLLERIEPPVTPTDDGPEPLPAG
jgi:hypothetical protein